MVRLYVENVGKEDEVMKLYLAIDIGASSGRHMIGFKNEKGEIVLEELYRFSNGVVLKDNHFIWNMDELWKEVKNGIRVCLEKYPKIESMSIDTWGVDYVLLKDNEIIQPVYAYRDSRTKDSIDEVHQRISFEDLYQITGSQFQEFNTIYQLYWDKKQGRLTEVTDFLMIPEYLMYMLTGIKVKEFTNASTTGCLDVRKQCYSKRIWKKLDFPKQFYTDLKKPGYEIGSFKESIQKELGGNIPVVLCPTHDTASAVEGIPYLFSEPYISSGTWSLLGIKENTAITTAQAKVANYSNEMGPSYVRFQKNIMGLWIIQCLAKQMDLAFPEMIALARKSNFLGLYDVNDPCFLSGLHMKEEIQGWFKRKQMDIPQTDEDILYTTYRSLAYSYKKAIDELEHILGRSFSSISIVGGGAKNELLNALTEEFTQKKVYAYAIEATALGNIISQMRRTEK